MQQMVWLNHSVPVGIAEPPSSQLGQMEENEFWTCLNQVEIGLDGAI